MFMRFQIVAVIGSLIYLGIVFEAVRRQKLKEAYALLWLASGVLFLALAVLWWPVSKISQYIGIYYPPASLFLVLIVGILLILIQFSILMSSRTEQIKELSQEVGLLRRRVNDLENRLDDGGEAALCVADGECPDGAEKAEEKHE